MNATLLKYWERLRASYWFIPTIMVTLALLGSFLTIYIDAVVGDDWLERIDWIQANKPEGARALLSAVATSSITVAGVVFSITITSVSLASQQFGPRLLTNFLRDRKNQVVLGTFLATFTYSILVLRTIRDADEAAFVPQISIILALVLTLASVGVLIFFIHHSSDSLRATTIIARVATDIDGALHHLYPQGIGRDLREVEGANAETDCPEDFIAESAMVRSRERGYIQGVDAEGLVELACEEDVILEVMHRPGEFVLEGETLVRVWPGARVTEEMWGKLNRLIITDRQRSPRQDVLFMLNELVEMSARALSTGVNDPFTAMGCIDHLSGACAKVLAHEFPSSYRYDEKGRLRIIADPIDFRDFAETAFGQLRPYASRDRNVSHHLLVTFTTLMDYAQSEEHREVLIKHARLIAESAADHMPRTEDQRMLREEFERFLTRAREGRLNPPQDVT